VEKKKNSLVRVGREHLGGRGRRVGAEHNEEANVTKYAVTKKEVRRSISKDTANKRGGIAVPHRPQSDKLVDPPIEVDGRKLWIHKG